MNFVQEIGHMIAPYAVPAIAVILGYFAKKAAKIIEPIIGQKNIAKIEQELKQKKGLAYDAVRFAEDAFSKVSGETKFKHAAQWMSNQAKALGLSITESEVEGLIKSAYADLTGAFTKDVKKAKPTKKDVASKPVKSTDKAKQ